MDPADATLDNIETVGEWIDQYKEVSDSTFREAYTSSPNIFLLYGDQESNKKKSGRKVHSLERTQRHPVDEQSNDPEFED